MNFSYPEELANEIRMIRSQYAGSFLVVEGSDDRHFMEHFICSDCCEIVVAQGKQKVCDVIRILENDCFPGCLGLVDADLDRIEGSLDRGPNILMYECHDLETMLIFSPALDRILREFGSQKKLGKLGERVLDSLLARALPVGYLRWYSQRERLDLKFEDLNYSKWIQRTSLVFDIGNLIKEVKNTSQRHDLPSSLLRETMQELAEAKNDTCEICNGTDLIEILSMGLRGKFGNNNANDVKVSILKRSLRLAYSEREFLLSRLGQSIRTWEVQGGFQILGNLGSE